MLKFFFRPLGTMQTSVKNISKKYIFVVICIRNKVSYALMNQTNAIKSEKIIKTFVWL